MVPEGGFEPPTRGFSIRCSTPELLGLHGKNRVGAQPIERRYTPWQAQNQSWSYPSMLSAYSAGGPATRYPSSSHFSKSRSLQP